MHFLFSVGNYSNFSEGTFLYRPYCNTSSTFAKLLKTRPIIIITEILLILLSHSS